MKNICDCLTKPFRKNNLYLKDKVNPQESVQNNE